MNRFRRFGGLGLLSVSAAAGAVSFGPLQRSGVTDRPGKAFYLSIANPYSTIERFQIRAMEAVADDAADRVVIFPSDLALGGGSRRQVLVIVKPLQPNETYRFRVCASRSPKPQETVNARVCSNLTARRLPARG